MAPSEINDFIKDDENNLFENYLNDIYYEDSIHMFQDLNALFFIFMEKEQKTNHTRRITMGHQTQKTRRNNHKEILKKNLKIFKEI